MEEFLAQLGELSNDSMTADALLRTQKAENKKLRSQLVSIKESSKEVLTMYRNERQITIKLQEKLDNTNMELQKLREQFNELERTDVNKVFHLKELMNEMKQDMAQEHSDYVELCKDYFELLSETTCFYNYEIKSKAQSKIITTTENFLHNVLGNAYKKPKIIRSKRMKSAEDEVSTTTRSSSRINKRNANQSRKNSESKRRKTEIWDMKSVSQASSPAATIPFADEDTSDLSSEICEVESSVSFNTFSIGNETSFSFLQGQKSSNSFQCKCHLYPDNGPALVSTGTNTEQPEDELPSIQRLLDGDFDLAFNEDGMNLSDCAQLELKSLTLPVIPQPAKTNIETEITEARKTTEIESLKEGKTSRSIECYQRNLKILPIVLEKSEEPMKTYATSSTNTEPECSVRAKETVEQGTSPETVATSHKSTATVRSSTTRGTSTVSVVNKSCGVQFPEISIENIFSETIFDLPDIISPIDSSLIDICENPNEMNSMETLTDLCNVSREISYTIKSPIKPEIPSHDDLVSSQDLEHKGFVTLGQTLFELFMKQIQKTSQLNDDETTRKRIWKHLKQQLVDSFSELTFDETWTSSFSDTDIVEHIATDPVEDQEVKCSKGYQSMVVDKEELETEVNKSKRDDCHEPGHSVGASPNAEMETKIVEEEEVISNLEASSSVEPEFEDSLGETDSPGSEQKDDLEIPELNEEESMLLEQFSEAYEQLEALYMTLPPLIEPIDDLSDVIWSSIFPNDQQISDSNEDGDIEESNVLEGFEVEHEPIEIPIETEDDNEIVEIFKTPVQTYSEIDSPKSPPPFVHPSNIEDVQIIPANESAKRRNREACPSSLLVFDPQIRQDLITWQLRTKIVSRKGDKELFKTRRALKAYLEAEWTDENLEICLKVLAKRNEIVIVESFYEVVEDFKSETDVNTEFTPPAPPLPRYQQKIVLLIKKLAENNQKLPYLLVENLEEKLFQLDNFAMPTEDLRNFAYYYSALIDLFFDGDSTTVLYFIVKCIYFFAFKSVPMVFVLLKAFPEALPKKSQLLKMYSNDIDWDNMHGLDLSKVHLNLEWMDSLDLTVIYVLIFMQKNGTRGEKALIESHELYPFIQKHYGFFLNLMTPKKLLDLLMKRLEDGQLRNISLSMILLAKRSKGEFTLRTMVRESLIPTLSKHLDEASRSGDQIAPLLVSQICILIESVTAIIKSYRDEKDLSFRQIFPMLVSTISRVKSTKIQEHCMKAILRLQRFMTNHKDVYSIIKAHVENNDRRISDGLRFAIQTFVHRKGQDVFKEIT